MRTLGTAALTTVLLSCTACGETSGGAQTPDPPTCADKGAVVARADLDGDGDRRPVRLTGPGGGACSDRLTGDGGGVDVADLDLATEGATAVHLRGGPDLVMVLSKSHPRGGAQSHLFGADADGALHEVTVGGHPLVPFVATDGGAAPMTATCPEGGGVAVLKGTASQPPGVVLAWDLIETSYEIRDAKVVDTSTRTIRRDAADPVLRKEMPELFDGSLFSDCT
jgi:hypothetical protein